MVRKELSAEGSRFKYPSLVAFRTVQGGSRGRCLINVRRQQVDILTHPREALGPRERCTDDGDRTCPDALFETGGDPLMRRTSAVSDFRQPMETGCCV